MALEDCCCCNIRIAILTRFVCATKEALATMTYVYYVICHTVNAFLFASFAVFAAGLPGKIQIYRLCMWRYTVTSSVNTGFFERQPATKPVTTCVRPVTKPAGWS